MAEWSQESQGKITDTSGLSCANTHRARSQFWRAWTDFWKLCVYRPHLSNFVCVASFFESLTLKTTHIIVSFNLNVLFSLSSFASCCGWRGWVVAVFSHMSRSIDSVAAAGGFGSAQQDRIVFRQMGCLNLIWRAFTATSSRHVDVFRNGNLFQVCFCSCSWSVTAIQQARVWLLGEVSNSLVNKHWLENKLFWPVSILKLWMKTFVWQA